MSGSQSVTLEKVSCYQWTSASDRCTDMKKVFQISLLHGAHLLWIISVHPGQQFAFYGYFQLFDGITNFCCYSTLFSQNRM